MSGASNMPDNTQPLEIKKNKYLSASGLKTIWETQIGYKPDSRITTITIGKIGPDRSFNTIEEFLNELIAPTRCDIINVEWTNITYQRKWNTSATEYKPIVTIQFDTGLAISEIIVDLNSSWKFDIIDRGDSTTYNKIQAEYNGVFNEDFSLEDVKINITLPNIKIQLENNKIVSLLLNPEDQTKQITLKYIPPFISSLQFKLTHENNTAYYYDNNNEEYNTVTCNYWVNEGTIYFDYIEEKLYQGDELINTATFYHDLTNSNQINCYKTIGFNDPNRSELKLTVKCFGYYGDDNKSILIYQSDSEITNDYSFQKTWSYKPLELNTDYEIKVKLFKNNQIADYTDKYFFAANSIYTILKITTLPYTAPTHSYINDIINNNIYINNNQQILLFDSNLGTHCTLKEQSLGENNINIQLKSKIIDKNTEEVITEEEILDQIELQYLPTSITVTKPNGGGYFYNKNTNRTQAEYNINITLGSYDNYWTYNGSTNALWSFDTYIANTLYYDEIIDKSCTATCNMTAAEAWSPQLTIKINRTDEEQETNFSPINSYKYKDPEAKHTLSFDGDNPEYFTNSTTKCTCTTTITEGSYPIENKYLSQTHGQDILNNNAINKFTYNDTVTAIDIYSNNTDFEIDKTFYKWYKFHYKVSTLNSSWKERSGEYFNSVDKWFQTSMEFTDDLNNQENINSNFNYKLLESFPYASIEDSNTLYIIFDTEIPISSVWNTYEIKFYESNVMNPEKISYTNNMYTQYYSTTDDKGFIRYYRKVGGLTSDYKFFIHFKGINKGEE